MSGKLNESDTITAAKINYKGTIIAACIGAVVVAMIAFLQHQKGDRIILRESHESIYNDSSQNVMITTELQTSDQSRIKNETVYSNKSINQDKLGLVPQKDKSKSTKAKNEPKENIETIQNNGNLSIGQTGGIVNQNTYNTSPPPLILTDELKKELIIIVNQTLNKLPKESNNCVQVEGVIGDSRSIKLSLMIGNYLESEGYNLKGYRQSMITNPPEDKSLGISILEGCVVITVYNAEY